MRIAHTVEFYWPKIGGAERVVQRVAEHLAARGHVLTVLTSAYEGRPAEEKHNGVLVKRIPVAGNQVKGIKGNPQDFIDEITDPSYDVVFNYAAQSWPTDLTLRNLDEVRGVKVLAPCGYSGLVGGKAQRLLYASYFRKLPRLLPQYDALVYHSPHYIDYEMGKKWQLDNGYVIPNGLDLAEFTAPTWDERDDLIVLIGNHYRAKGHDDFFKLARMLQGKARFALVAVPEAQGYKTCIEECTRLAAELDVELVDGRDRSRLVSTLTRAKVLAVTSRIECSPLTALEAMAAGAAFVAFDVGCLRDYPGGIIVRDLDAMSTTIGQLVTDRGRWEELSELGRAYVGSLDWSTVARRYEDLYESLLERRAVQSR